MSGLAYKPGFLYDGAAEARNLFIFAHGAGQGMDAPFMVDVATLLAQTGHRVARFEFPYMAAARAQGKRKPPDRMPRLLAAWNDAIALCEEHGWPRQQIVIGGKSMGGRVASMVADEQKIAGLVCLGYPFHPPGKADKPRVEHLATIATPTLICQGERDTFGTPDDVAGYHLASQIDVCWLADGDHSFKPRKRSGRTLEANLDQAASRITQFISSLPPR